MAFNYSKGQPLGDNGVPQHQVPAPIKAIIQYVNENAIASSVISVSDNTTAIEIGAGAAAVVMRWVTQADTQASVVAIAGVTSNFDHYIGSNTVRRFVIPIEVQSNSQGYSSMVGDNRAYGLFRRFAVKAQAIGSVLATEYGKSNSY